MRGRKRNARQIKRDRVRIAEMYCQQRYQYEIADELGCSQQQVSYDIRAIQKEWQVRRLELIDNQKSMALAKINHLERTYWQAWEDSENDPRYLKGVEWCIDQRCKLFGLYQQMTFEGGIIINLISSDKVNIDEC